MTAYVVEISGPQGSAVVRDAGTALARLAALHGTSGSERHPPAHRLRIAIERATTEPVSLRYHALDAAGDTAFMELAVANGPDPWFRLTQARMSLEAGKNLEESAAMLLVRAGEDMEQLKLSSGRPFVRLRMLHAEFSLDAYHGFEGIAAIARDEGNPDAVAPALCDVLTLWDPGRIDKFASLQGFRNR